MDWWSQATRDPAHVPVVIWRITTCRPTPSADSISRKQNMMTGPNCKASEWPRAAPSDKSRAAADTKHPEDHDSPTDTQCRRYQPAAEHEPVSTGDPAHGPVVIRGTTTRRPTHSAADISRQQNKDWWSQATRDPAHVPVVIWRITTRRPTPSADSISRKQNMMTGPNCKASEWPRAAPSDKSRAAADPSTPLLVANFPLPRRIVKLSKKRLTPMKTTPGGGVIPKE
jgi:hypothetical protein